MFRLVIFVTFVAIIVIANNSNASNVAINVENQLPQYFNTKVHIHYQNQVSGKRHKFEVLPRTKTVYCGSQRGHDCVPFVITHIEVTSNGKVENIQACRDALINRRLYSATIQLIPYAEHRGYFRCFVGPDYPVN